MLKCTTIRNTVTWCWSPLLQDQEDSTTTVLAMQLNAGDQVNVFLPEHCQLCDSNSHFNTFSGFLLYATD